jgi:type I restriction enzyme S subunit
MNPEQLLIHFDRISEAVDAIPRLRCFILDLAVRGKLVGQDAADEPASELLARIRAKKAQLINNGELRKEKSAPPENEPPFPIPTSWCWSQLAEVGILNPRNMAVDDLPTSFVPMPLISGDYGIGNKHEVRPWGDIKRGYTHFAEGDVGLAKITPCFENAKSTVFRGLTGGMGAGTTELHIVRPVILSADYILIFLKCPYFIATGIPKMTGTAGQKRVPANYFAYSPFPLPPLAEQLRVVSKVGELIALCDRLEAAQTERKRRRDRLTAASLNRLNDFADADAPTFHEHARFHLRNLPRLTVQPDQIPQLRHTILNLAVCGKLVTQESEVEAVTIFLDRVDNERVNVAKTDRRADADSQSLLGSEYCWKIPDSWEWRGLADLALFIDYRGRTPAKCESGIPLITAKNVRTGFINIHPEEFIDEPTYKGWMTRGIPRKGDVLFTTEAPMGNAAVLRLVDKIGLAQRVINFRLYAGLDPDFLVLQILAQPFQRILETTATGLTAKGIKAAKLKRLPIAVPPLTEQRRIVVRVQELFAICDQLEAQITTSQIERRRLLDAVLHQALVEPA